MTSGGEAFVAAVKVTLGCNAELVQPVGTRFQAIAEFNDRQVLVHSRGEGAQPFAVYSDEQGWQAFATRDELLALIG